LHGFLPGEEGESDEEKDMRKILLTFALFMFLGLTPLTQQAQAWGGVRIGIGLPLYVGPSPYYYGYPYRYYYPPAYVVPAPQVVYQTAPPTVVALPAPGLSEAIPAAPAPQANAAPVTPSAAPLPFVTNVIPASNPASPQVDALVRQLTETSETARRDAALQLGRLKANSAVDALVNVLAKDSSPIARDGAARALGLIASPTSLKALIYAAQADDDREVRHSAQFAVEVIRSSLRGN
jgi:HEAT repeats